MALGDPVGLASEASELAWMLAAIRQGGRMIAFTNVWSGDVTSLLFGGLRGAVAK